MAATLKASFQTAISHLTDWAIAPKKGEARAEEVHMLGEYKVDYSEPTQAQIDAANAQCADLFKTGEWISVNRKS